MVDEALNPIEQLLGVEKWSFRYHLQRLKLLKFKQKINFCLEVGDYLVKTAESPEELKEVLSLRHEIFIEEGLGENRLGAIDFDKYDLLADHILLIDKRNKKVVGTYRVLSTGFSDSFYSEREFQLVKFLKSPGLKIELGRACVKKEYRKGIAIHLIWKGLGRYASLTGAEKMFGCASIKITSQFSAMRIIDHLKPKYHSDDYEIQPKPKYNKFDISKQLYCVLDVENIIPPLIKSYLKAGAKIHGAPAYDAEFRCVDFFTVFDTRAVEEKYKNKYFKL